MELLQKLVHPDAKPFNRNPSDADAVGYDIFSPMDFALDPLSRRLVKVGVKTEFPPGMVGMICDRSGLGNKGVTVFGGIIDPSYRGEWGVILYNSTAEVINIEKGKAIAQVLFIPVVFPITVLVDGELSESGRGDKGFGSSDK